MTDQTTESRAPNWFLVLVASTVGIGILWVGRGFLIPLAITGLLYILTSALVDRWKKLRLGGRAIPLWLANLLSAATVIGTISLFGLILSSSADEVQAAWPTYQERFVLFADQLETWLGPRVFSMFSAALQNVDIGGWAAAIANQIGGAVSMFGLVVLYLAFLLSEQSEWREKLPRLASTPEGTQRARKVLDRISMGVKQYMWVNAVTSAMSGVVAFLIFSLVGLDFAALLALIVFVAGFVPNIGAFIAIVLPSLLALVQFDTWTPCLIVFFGYGLADQFIANVIQPSMQGHSLNLSTFMVMVSLTFWAMLWGGIGAFLAVPMMVVAMVVCAEISGARWFAVLLSSDGLLRGQGPENAF